LGGRRPTSLSDAHIYFDGVGAATHLRHDHSPTATRRKILLRFSMPPPKERSQ
jgi:hypothetical protein